MATALFVCLHNAGRSQSSTPEVVEVMRELGYATRDDIDRRVRQLVKELDA